MEVRGQEKRGGLCSDWFVKHCQQGCFGETLGYDARRATQGQEQEVYCQIPEDMCLIFDVDHDTQ